MMKSCYLVLILALTGMFNIQNTVSGDCCCKCPSNSWRIFDKNCYFVSYWTATTWQTAQKLCMNSGADLTSITSPEEQGYIYDWTKKVNLIYGSAAYFIGLHDLITEGSWVWIDGSAYSHSNGYKNWASGRPITGVVNTIDCSNMMSTGKWADIHCNHSRRYICKKKCC
uniref:Toxin candidate TRINITY_DN7481_c0_g1_i1.p1 n=1 Tax=Pachycerianthus borealis TaxID=2736680 RepID=A0A7G7WYV8_9CNID|nr:toxin candidate TRINITY_DN7481_c0_g1_i1.p1 [Pachycerianthus borealis]